MAVNNNRIAKNTFFLYIRMMLTMVISIYTSRIILEILGETDFGIYNVVGGFVSMFTMVSGALSAATQRFLSYELGKGEHGHVNEVFSTSIMMHILIAFIILVLAETVGLWFVNEKMIFPEARYNAANWVYQLSLMTFLVDIVSVPYNAALVAYERMKAFAYVSIIEVVLKLIVVYMLLISPIDRLVFYASLLSLISILIRVLYGYYVKRNLAKCRCNYVINKEIGKQMVSFMGWNMFGAGAIVANGQGVNVLLNLFFGAAVNAARGIVFQVQGAIRGFVTNFQLAMAPQIIKSYASNDTDEMFSLVFNGARFSFLLMMNLALPIILKAPFILDLWLVHVPSYTVIFLRIVLVTTLIESLGTTLSYAMHASGKVRNYQIVVGSLSLLALPIIYEFLRFGCPPFVAFFVVLFFAIISLLAQVVMLHLSINLPILVFLKNVFARSVFVFVASIPVPVIIDSFFKKGDCFSFVVVTLVCVGSSFICSLYLGLSALERGLLFEKIGNLMNKMCHKR